MHVTVCAWLAKALWRIDINRYYILNLEVLHAISYHSFKLNEILFIWDLHDSLIVFVYPGCLHRVCLSFHASARALTYFWKGHTATQGTNLA